MKSLQAHLFAILRHWPLLFSARGIVVLLCLVSVLPPVYIPWLKWVDDGIYQLAATVTARPQGESRVAVVTLPPAAHIGDYIDRTRLVEIRAGGPVNVVLITDQNLTDLGPELASYQVIVGRSADPRTGKLASGVYDFSSQGIVSWPDGIPWYTRLLRLVHDDAAPLTLRQDAVPGYRSLPVAGSTGLLDYPMIWQRSADGMQDLVSFVYKLHTGSSIPVDVSFKLRGLHGRMNGLPPRIHQYPLRDLVASRDFTILRNAVVLIGAADDPALINAANMLDDLFSQQTAVIPYWAILLKCALALLVLLYLLMQGRFRAQTAVLLTSIAIGILVVSQFGVLLTRHAWLPLGTVAMALLLGHFIMYAAYRRHAHSIELANTHDMTLRSLASYQLESGKLEHALVSLQQCKTTNELLELLYRTGIEYERQRKYVRALETFKHLHSRQKNYQDVRSRIATLEHASDPTGAVSVFNGARTLVMPAHGVEKPVLGRYQVERELGRGAMGVVYLGRDPKIQRMVAIKTLDLKQFSAAEAQNITARFFREAEAAGKLNHPNIVTIFDAGEDGDLAYIAMDYATGKPLSEWTGVENLLPVATVCHIIAQVAQAIDYAHRQGIVHRDIKPGNIIYDPEAQRVRVTDFGIARITDTNATRTGTILGSPSYMAPEQVTQSKVDGRADIFSLGVTLYQLLTGELPFSGDSLASVAYQITNKKQKSPRDYRPELSMRITRIINKALQKNPAKRFETAEEMADALQRV